MDYEQIIEEGSGTNEDLCQVVPEYNMAWVIDGSSGVSDKTLFPDAMSDGRWFVNRINSYILKKVGDAVSLTNLIRYAIRETTIDAVEEMAYSGHPKSQEFDAIDETLTTLDLPSATIAMADWSDNTVEVISLGDSGVVVSKMGGTSYISQGDPKQYAKLQDENASEEEQVEMMKEARKRQQIPGGYWVLGFNPIAVDFAVEERYYKPNVDNILISTDGFTPIVDKYGIYDDWEQVINQVQKTSLQTLVNELREYEEDNNNENGNSKKHDDVALVHIQK